MSKNKVQQNQGRSDDQICDSIEHPMVWQWMRQLLRKDPASFKRLARDNTHFFTSMVGEPKWKAEDGHDEWTTGWQIQHHGITWIILTGSKGTYYRVRLPLDGKEYLSDARVGTGMLSFLQELCKDLQIAER